MKSTTFIYTLSDINGDVRYIGKSNTPRKRLYSHIKECKTSNKSHKINWIKSLILKDELPIMEVLDEVIEENWEFWEQYWIEQFRQWGFNLTNISIGGTNNNYKRSIETKQKMRVSKLGTKLSEDQKDRISQSVRQKYKDNPGYNRSGNNIKKIIDRDFIYSLYITDNLSIPTISKKTGLSQRKIYDTLKEYDIEKPKEIWQGQCASKSRKVVIQYDLKGKLVKEWNCLSDIAKELGFKSNIANCCRGIGVSAGGYIWRYKDNFIEIDLNKLNYQSRKVSQYDLQANFIKSFDSIKEASSEGFREGNIQDCCVGRLKSSKGFIWRYSEDSPPEKYKSKNIKSVLQFTPFDELIKECNSIYQASKELGIGSNSITTCCKGKYKSAGGYI